MKISSKTKFFLYNLLAVGILVVLLGYLVLSRLDEYTRHGYSIAVPSFRGMTPEEAADVAQHYKLRVEIVDSLYDEDAVPGSVVEQYPSENSRVKETRLIHLTINAHAPEKVVFPNLKNASYRQALQTLQARGFKIGHIGYAPSEFKNLVLDLQYQGENLTPNALLPKGATIDIILGAGIGNNMVYTPVLVGKTLREATALALQGYLNIGEIVTDATTHIKQAQASATVYQQIPALNYRVTAGTPVTLYITHKKDKITAIDSLMVTE